MEISEQPQPPSRSNDNPLGRLVEEHRQYSRKLESILAQSYLSENEQIEAARLKKLKLKLKDEMAGYTRSNRTNQLQV
jgi:uncharacterized protein YdcH (DUF465 family)